MREEGAQKRGRDKWTGTGRIGKRAGPDRQELMALAVNESNAAVYVTDENAKIVFINRTFTTMLGYEPARGDGPPRPRRARRRALQRRGLRAPLGPSSGRGRSVQEEVRTHDRNGREVWLTLVLRPVFADDSSFKHLVGILEDTTESRQIQKLQRDVLEAVAQEMALRDVMTLICERVEAMFPEVVSSILAVDTERTLRPLAAPSLPPSQRLRSMACRSAR